MRVKPSMEEQFAEVERNLKNASLDYRTSSKQIRYFWNTRHDSRGKYRCWEWRIVLRSIFEEFEEMATKGKAAPKAENKAFEGDYKFVNLSLTDEHINNALIVYENIDLVWDTLVVMMRDGYKFSLSYDERSDSFCATITGVRCTTNNKGKILTGWADNEYDAMRFVLYKHTTVLDGNWGRAGDGERRRG